NSEITDNPLLATENRGLPYIGVEIDGDTYYTDFNGYLTVNFITEPTEATINLEGLYARVYQGISGSSMETIDVTLDAGENVIEFDDLSGATPSEVSAYYQQNVVHDYMKTHFAGFTGLDIDQLIRVDRTDGECNAFYDGASINFYEADGGCPATALFNDVVFHEYGHGINYDVYDYLGGSWNNGALGEGYADLWGMCITENPNLANGFFGGSGPLREYDAAPKVYPEDLLGEVHADGEIIAGAWWDVAENFGDDVQEMAELWAETWLATPMQPGGNEGQLYSDILLEALIADDDNADLSDGTPRFDEITTAFCEHGIGLLGQVSTDHEGTLSFVSADEPISIEVELDIDYPLFIGYMDMHYQINGAGAWTTASMELVSGSTYKTDIPAQEAGTIISYYLKTADENDCGELVLPINADLAVDPNLPYFALVGHTLLHTEDFDNIAGAWDFDPFGTDEAETGEWNINEPIASFDATGYQVQTSQDHTSGSSNLCAFTANASSLSSGVGENDVDNGETTLRTPVFDMSGYDDPAITYFRIYSNASPTSANPGNDVWQARISNDLENWVKIERTGTEDNSWRRNAIRVKDYVELTSTVAIIFIAQDSVIPSAELEGGSLIEGAIDDLQIWDIGEPDTTEDNIAEIESLINTIFPNPTSDYVNIFFGNVQEEMQITIINELGEIIKTQNIEAVAGGKYILDCRQIAAGIYTLNCKTKSGYVNKKLVITD
ncbi:MAG: T9SS type A sorting domain-containing protein, partial [Fimbriimonadaceae bacterium]|nr:T9SS type A sorting domain-containing protein [Chitinophagales bacterium]